jgi:hypothetical protein
VVKLLQSVVLTRMMAERRPLPSKRLTITGSEDPSVVVVSGRNGDNTVAKARSGS